MLAIAQGDSTAARRHFERILQLASVQPARRLRAGAHIQLGNLALREADLTRALTLFEQAIEILGDTNEWMVANAVSGLARVARMQGDGKLAGRLAEDALAVYRRVGDESQTATAATFLGTIALDAGELDSARARFSEGLTLSLELDDPSGVGFGLVGFASLAVAERRPERALRLLGAASAFARRSDAAFVRVKETMTRASDAARAMLTEQAANTALAAGQGLTLDQAVEEALTVEVATPSSEGHARPSALTRRETEVAQWIARGLTNRQIAETLIISERTVDNHVANILGKLGFSARAQVAAWSVENGLGNRYLE
jgi:DNA-binding CsgD family transcriptional regulator